VKELIETGHISRTTQGTGIGTDTTIGVIGTLPQIGIQLAVNEVNGNHHGKATDTGKTEIGQDPKHPPQVTLMGGVTEHSQYNRRNGACDYFNSMHRNLEQRSLCK